MAVKKRRCGKGWLVTPSKTDGEYVPFFMYVRDKDIIWDETNLPELLRKTAAKGENMSLNYPMYQWNFDVDSWSVKLHQDGSYEATKKIDINKNCEMFDSSQIDVSISLPFKTMNDDEFNIQITKNCHGTDMLHATVNMNPLENEESNDVISVSLLANGFYFNTDLETNEQYNDQFLFVRVTGFIHFEED